VSLLLRVSVRAGSRGRRPLDRRGRRACAPQALAQDPVPSRPSVVRMSLLSLSGTTLLLLLIGLTLLVGFASDFLANRLRIPDVIWLMLLGLLIGPGLGLVSSSQLLTFAPLLGVAALVLILFDAGLDMQFAHIRAVLAPAFAFSTLSYAASALVLFVGTMLTFPSVGVPAALLFGLSLACISGAIVIPLARQLRLNEDLNRLALLDGALEDAFAIIAVTALLSAVAPAAAGGLGFHLALSLALPIPVGIAIGVVGGLVWMEFLSVWQDEPYAALATLGFLLVIYTVTEVLGGSGIIAALVLGVVLANEGAFHRFFRSERKFRLAPSLRKVEGEIAFLLRSFFLLLLGVLVDPRALSLVLWVSLMLATIVLFLVRWGLARTAGGPSNLRGFWAPTLAGLYGRGLTSAVLIVLAFDVIPNASTLIVPAVMLVLLTNVVMTVWLLYLSRTRGIPQSTSARPPPEPDLVIFGPDPGRWDGD
jgi:potassium/hydrogen antiporter